MRAGAQGEEKARRALALYARAAGAEALPEAEREELSARAGAAADACGTAAMAEAAERLHAARFKPTDKLPPGQGPRVGQKRAAPPAAADEDLAAKRQAYDAAAAGYPPASAAPAAGSAAYYAQQAGAYGYAAYYAQYPPAAPAYPAYSYAQY